MIPARTHKRCPHCRRWLPFEAFNKNKRMKSGLSSWCRECHVAATKRWRNANPELIRWMNERRRLGERERQCVDCQGVFAYKHASAVRCPDCRRRRKLEQRRAVA